MESLLDSPSEGTLRLPLLQKVSHLAKDLDLCTAQTAHAAAAAH